MRPTSLNLLFSSIQNIKGVGQKTVPLLKNLFGNDLLLYALFHKPTGLICRQKVDNVIQLQTGFIPIFKVKVLEHTKPHSKKAPYRILCEIASLRGALLEIAFFNYHKSYLIDLLPVGEERLISGQVEWYNNVLQMAHPDYIVTPEEEWKIPLYEPVYPLTQGISNKMVRFVIKEALKALPDLPEWLDETLIKREGWPSFKQALIALHEPKSQTDLDDGNKARARLAYDEMLAGQIALLLIRSRMKKMTGNAWNGTGLLTAKLKQLLPFELTGAQKRVISEIFMDLKSTARMNRLLQGDVGSGKTIVALFAMLHIVESGAQAALMAPTDILSRQHYKKISQLCEKLGVSVSLLTGRDKGKKKQEILSDIKSGKAQIVIGTHALFTPEVEFNNLGLVIIDEQHRFGVEQRLFLTRKGKHPDLLVMTATPIPRTLALTYYGDMDISVIDEKPANRQKTDTRVLYIKQMEATLSKLKNIIDEGHQIYWVCPLIEESEKSDLANATERFEKLSILFPDQVCMIHGKMKGDEKDKIMQDFLDKKKSILVATTVIEVGVDVPNATVMIIEEAQRFGLAQLHQLRGRIGRGSDKSTCLLLYDYPLSEVAKKRLEVMRQTDDGFVIAEEDLKLRGSGEVLGTRQSGLENMRLASVVQQQEMLSLVRQDALGVIKTDETLTSHKGQALQNLLYLFEKDKCLPLILAG